jgi:hypothetical protein
MQMDGTRQATFAMDHLATLPSDDSRPEADPPQYLNFDGPVKSQFNLKLLEYGVFLTVQVEFSC